MNAMIGLLLLVLITTSTTEDPFWKTFSRGVTIYDKKDGLQSNSIYGVVRSSDEQLWLHTNNGVFRFDGQTFRQVPGTEGKNVILANIVADTLLAAMSFDNTADIIPIRNISETRPLDIPDTLRPRAFMNYILARRDTLFVGTSEGVILRRTSAGWEHLTRLPDIVFNQRIGYMFFWDSKLQIVSTAGSWEYSYSGGTLNRTGPHIRFSGKPEGLGNSWLPGHSFLHALEGNKFREIAGWEEVGIRSFATQVAEKSPGDLWIATLGDGIIRLRVEFGKVYFRAQ